MDMSSGNLQIPLFVAQKMDEEFYGIFYLLDLRTAKRGRGWWEMKRMTRGQGWESGLNPERWEKTFFSFSSIINFVEKVSIINDWQVIDRLYILVVVPRFSKSRMEGRELQLLVKPASSLGRNTSSY